MMSPANRHAAKLIRHLWGGAYLLLLLIVLLYVAFRIWRWRQSVERKRRIKAMGRRQAEYDSYR